jgi:N-hydroxyarylamine O-acetyltransferase
VHDFGSYLTRIGVDSRPTLAELHRAHVSAVPFENLDPYAGTAVSLAPEALERKLVAERRGGYCFEQNLLMMSALHELGATVEPMLARVRWGVPAGTITPRTHLVLHVELDGAAWLADVGFGAGTLLEPIRFGPGGPYEQSGWRFRVVRESDQLVLQTDDDGVWRDVYAFEPRPAPLIDIELSNWFTATHPKSRFVTGLIVTRQTPDGARVSLSDWTNGLALTVRTPERADVTPVERSEIPALLAERFGLTGFAHDGAGRLVRSG